MALKKREFTPESGSVDTYGLSDTFEMMAEMCQEIVNRMTINNHLAAMLRLVNLPLKTSIFDLGGKPWGRKQGSWKEGRKEGREEGISLFDNGQMITKHKE